MLIDRLTSCEQLTNEHINDLLLIRPLSDHNLWTVTDEWQQCGKQCAMRDAMWCTFVHFTSNNNRVHRKTMFDALFGYNDLMNMLFDTASKGYNDDYPHTTWQVYCAVGILANLAITSDVRLFAMIIERDIFIEVSHLRQKHWFFNLHSSAVAEYFFINLCGEGSMMLDAIFKSNMLKTLIPYLTNSPCVYMCFTNALHSSTTHEQLLYCFENKFIGLMLPSLNLPLLVEHKERVEIVLGAILKHVRNVSDVDNMRLLNKILGSETVAETFTGKWYCSTFYNMLNNSCKEKVFTWTWQAVWDRALSKREL